MRALIFEVPGLVGMGWVDVAGRPLVMRQAQWLRDLGIEEIVVEVCAGIDDAARGTWLLSDDPLVSRALVIPSGEPLGADELARRAGIASDERVLYLAAHMLCGGTVDMARDRATQWLLSPPPDIQTSPATLAIKARRDLTVERTEASTAWGMGIENLSDALEASCAALEGRATGLLVHALEQSKGVWLARGAHVDASARVEPPAYLGIDTLVLANAQVGPRAVVLDRAVIERGASVIDGCVAPSTLVGEGARVRRALATPRSLMTFDDGSRTSVFDSLVLSSRGTDALVSVRLSAILPLTLLLLPWLLGALWTRLRGRGVYRSITTRSGPTLHVGTIGVWVLDLFPAFFDVFWGARDLVGIGRPDLIDIAARRPHSAALPRAGAIDITDRLGNRPSASTALRLWRWYARRKKGPVDRALLAGTDPVQ